MTEKLQIYRCNICGNVVEVLSESYGELVCCNEAMELIKEKNDDENLNEKHVPVITKNIDGYNVAVGAILHPMTNEHHICFVQAISQDKKYVKTKFLSLDDEPEMNLKAKCTSLWARALCNIHGLFKGEYNEFEN